jgi:YVTN family beta-propeller protein
VDPVGLGVGPGDRGGVGDPGTWDAGSCVADAAFVGEAGAGDATGPQAPPARATTRSEDPTRPRRERLGGFRQDRTRTAGRLHPIRRAPTAALRILRAVVPRRSIGLIAALVIASSCTPAPSPTQSLVPSAVPSAEPSPQLPSPTDTPIPSDTPEPSASASATLGGVYAATIDGRIQSAWSAMPERVYVPDEVSGDVVVIDPATYKIIGRFKVGAYPEHITPAWDGQILYVNDMNSGSLTEIDPRTGRPNGVVLKVPDPYNLYFTPDGSRSIVVRDMTQGAPAAQNGMFFYDRKTWTRVGYVPIPWAGANHLDFSADGSTLFISCEYSGRIVAVDVAKMKIITSFNVGGSPTDVRLSPDGKVIFVANQVRNGIDVIDTATLKYVSFIPAGPGAHGLAISRDATQLLVTNRHAGSVSVIDIATRTVVAVWHVGGTPDMMAQSPDGSQLWISNRYSGTITVVDTATGTVITTIQTGINPHGLSYWPQPGRFSLGHNGNMR